MWDVIWSPKLEPQVWFRSPRFGFGALGWQDKSSSTPYLSSDVSQLIANRVLSLCISEYG